MHTMCSRCHVLQHTAVLPAKGVCRATDIRNVCAQLHSLDMVCRNKIQSGDLQLLACQVHNAYRTTWPAEPAKHTQSGTERPKGHFGCSCRLSSVARARAHLHIQHPEQVPIHKSLFAPQWITLCTPMDTAMIHCWPN